MSTQFECEFNPCEDANEEGYQAFFEGKKVTDCPYAIGTPDAGEWRLGWERAQEIEDMAQDNPSWGYHL